LIAELTDVRLLDKLLMVVFQSSGDFCDAIAKPQNFWNITEMRMSKTFWTTEKAD
jgi:hypothetical protein